MVVVVVFACGRDDSNSTVFEQVYIPCKYGSQIADFNSNCRVYLQFNIFADLAVHVRICRK